MVVCVHSYLLKVVVLAANSQTLLRVGHTCVLGGFVAEYDVLELVHSGIGEHKGGIILDDHRSGRNNCVSLASEKVFVRLAYLFGSKHLYVVCFNLFAHVWVNGTGEISP